MDELDDIHTAYSKLYKVSQKHENFIDLLQRSSVRWNQNEKNSSPRLMKQIRPLELCDFRTIFWLKGPRNCMQNCSKLELNWKGLQVPSKMKCLTSRKHILTKPVWGMIILSLLIILLLVLIIKSFLSILLIMITMRIMNLKMKVQVRVRVKMIRENLFQEHPPKTVKKETKQNGHHSTSKKSQPKKPHFCHNYRASRHTHPNCYKWLATQQSNSVSSFGSQNQLQLSLAPLGELLKVVMLLSNFNGFNSPSYPPEQRFMQKKGSSSRSPIQKEKDSK